MYCFLFWYLHVHVQVHACGRLVCFFACSLMHLSVTQGVYVCFVCYVHVYMCSRCSRSVRLYMCTHPKLCLFIYLNNNFTTNFFPPFLLFHPNLSPPPCPPPSLILSPISFVHIPPTSHAVLPSHLHPPSPMFIILSHESSLFLYYPFPVLSPNFIFLPHSTCPPLAISFLILFFSTTPYPLTFIFLLPAPPLPPSLNFFFNSALAPLLPLRLSHLTLTR